MLNLLDEVGVNASTLRTLNSRHLFLELTSEITWDQFPDFAERLMHLIGGRIKKKTDTVDIRIWVAVIQGEDLRLVFEDFPVLVSLESDTDDGDILLKKIKEKLSR